MVSGAKLLLAGAALLAMLLTIGCGSSKSTLTSTPTPGTTETHTATPGTSPSSSALALTLDLGSGRVKRGEEFSVVVNLDPLGRGVSGAQVSIEYDSAVLQAVGAEPGDLLGPDPAEAGPTIDHAKGTIDYAAARIGPTQGPTSSGSFATLTFSLAT